MRDIRKPFGQRVRELRLANGMTQAVLAEAADLHPVYVSGIERGLRSPRINVVDRIARALRVSPAELFSEPTKSAAAAKRGRPRNKMR